MRVVSLAVLALGACTSAEPDDSSEDTGDSDSDSDWNFDTSDTGPDNGSARVAGRVTDASGTPLVGVRVNACRDICRTRTTEADGGFVFESLEAWTHSFDAEPPHETGLASSLVPLTLVDGEDRALDVALPAFGAPVPVPGTRSEVEVTPGVHLTVGAGDLSILLSPDPVSELQGVAVAEAILPHLELPGDPVRVWYLGPFKAGSAAGVPVRLDNPWALPEGETYELWYSVYETFTWEKAGELTVSGGALTGEAKVTTLTTLVLLDPTP